MLQSGTNKKVQNADQSHELINASHRPVSMSFDQV